MTTLACFLALLAIFGYALGKLIWRLVAGKPETLLGGGK